MDQIEQLKFTNDETKSEFIENMKWSEQNPELNKTFLSCVDRLSEWIREGTEVWIGHDFAPRSFSFAVLDVCSDRSVLNGGMIFHGSHDNGGDGSAPTFSVNLSPHDGWRLHT